MLPKACRWTDSPDASHLYWNYGCIGIVRLTDGRWHTIIMWQGRDLTAPAGSRDQGKRWVTRWVAVQRGFPGLRKKRR